MYDNSKHHFHRVLVIIATLNEEDGIGPTLAELDYFLSGCQFLVVDGNSVDRTVEIAKNFGARILVQLDRGKGDALHFGFRNIDDVFDYVVLIDGDYTYPADSIPDMIEVLVKDENVGMVCGNRFNGCQESGSMGWIFHVGNKILCFAHNFFNDALLTDPLTGLRVVRSEIVKNWSPKSTGFDIEVELNNHVKRQGYQIVELDIPYRSRVGEKKLKFIDGFTIFKRIIDESMH